MKHQTIIDTKINETYLGKYGIRFSTDIIDNIENIKNKLIMQKDNVIYGINDFDDYFILLFNVICEKYNKYDSIELALQDFNEVFNSDFYYEYIRDDIYPIVIDLIEHFLGTYSIDIDNIDIIDLYNLYITFICNNKYIKKELFLHNLLNSSLKISILDTIKEDIDKPIEDINIELLYSYVLPAIFNSELDYNKIFYDIILNDSILYSSFLLKNIENIVLNGYLYIDSFSLYYNLIENIEINSGLDKDILIKILNNDDIELEYGDI